MTQTTPYPLRLPADMRNELEAAAKAAGRSLQQEILLRLQASLESGEPANEQPDFASQVQELRRRLEVVEQTISDLSARD
jgi:hypothetical protein